MSSSNCCFLTCIQISQEADQVVWYSHLFQNFPQFIVIHTVKGFGIETIKNQTKILELKNTMTELKKQKQKSMQSFNNRLDNIEEWISKLSARIVEITDAEQRKKNENKWGQF